MTNTQEIEEIEEELKYLRWFYINADFGPAHADVMQIMNEEFEKKTGCIVPEGYRDEE